MISYKNFNLDKMTDNINSIYQLASDAEIADGRSWYRLAYRFSQTLADKHDLSLPVVVGIIAALSPETSWTQNIIDAENLITLGDNCTVSTYPNNKLKALGILYGDICPIDRFVADSRYNWRKTAAFFQNILRPDDTTTVTIDRHAARIAHDYYITADDAIYYSNTVRKYETTAKSYKILASDLNILPQQLQAITWLTYRRLFVTRKRQDTNLNDKIYHPITL